MTVSFAEPGTPARRHGLAEHCVTPCVVRVPVGEYRVIAWGADRIRVWNTVTIGGDELALRVRPGRARDGGGALIGTGGGSIVLGLIVMAMPWLGQAIWRSPYPPTHTEPWLMAGGVLVGGGVVNIIAGGLVLRGRIGGIDVNPPVRARTRLAITPLASATDVGLLAGVSGEF
jgi:hypothetical protein